MSYFRNGVRLGIFGGLLAVLVATGLYLWLRPTATSPGPAATALASPPPPRSDTGAEATPVPEPAPAPTPTIPPIPRLCLEDVCKVTRELPGLGIPIHFVDESATYNWTVPSAACLAALASFVDQEEMVWSDIAVVLKDELHQTGTPVEFQYPPSADPLHDPAPDAVMARCTVVAPARSRVACQVQVQAASELPNPNLEIALMAAALDGLRRVHHEEFLQALESFYHYSELELFVPVLQPHGDAWQSQCLQVLDASAAGTP